ncbi:hypothetical protein Acy02nite_32580 [Actinoplanes cyaneus]|uniref:Lipoprotein n=1 Tax=Actinoplanes cyaneus TaxID=52696 RepID=A0A919M4A2_9ACTN|nr:hypothetical protein [Actinoplanes cyaneus]MCW2142570.1 hypothetical protein [Actinoplanes cyaneus]GID65377.1 hypothetical protein Acy02nite_32580 [Actinoplanes cyaneus]
MSRPVTTAVIAATLGITAGCGAPTAGTDQVAATSRAPEAPDVVNVVCSPSGTVISGTRFAARGDGVHVHVESTSGASGVYLDYSSDRLPESGGGEPVEAGTDLVLGVAPGPVTLNCAYDTGSRQDPPVTIEVLDPAGAWRTGALDALGCSAPNRSLVEWVYRPGTGPTADVALAGLAAQLDKPVTWRHVQDGYVDSSRQTFVAMRDGKPWATAQADRSPADGTFSVYLGSLCSGAEMPRSS